MTTITRLIGHIDRISEWLGRLTAWAAVAMVLVTCYIVLQRYAFDSGAVAVQETIIYLNGLLVICCAGFTLKHNGHVRVDIIYSKASPRYRAIVNLLGTLCLLLPVCLFIFLQSLDYVAASWRIREQSGEAGGLPWVYLLKTLILVLPVVLALQGMAEALRAVVALRLPPADREA